MARDMTQAQFDREADRLDRLSLKEGITRTLQSLAAEATRRLHEYVDEGKEPLLVVVIGARDAEGRVELTTLNPQEASELTAGGLLSLAQEHLKSEVTS